MSQPENANPEQSARRRSKLRGPILVVLALLLALGAFQLLYAKQKHDYLVRRDFRLLDTMGRKIAKAIAGQNRVVRSLAELEVPTGEKPAAVLGQLQDYLDLKLHLVECQESDSPAAKDGLHQSVDRLPNGGYRLSLRFKAKERRICGSVDLQQLLEPLFGPRSQQAFDTMLVVQEEDGAVIYQPLDRQSEIGIHRFDLLLETAGLPKPKGDDKAAGGTFQAALRTLTGPRHQLDVEVRGRAFKLFAEPVSVAVPALAGSQPSTAKDREAKSETAPHQIWLICGLVSNEKLLFDSLKVPPSFLGAAVAVLALALMSWPLLKLRLLGERQRVRLVDLLLIALCSLLGASLLTLLLLDHHHHRELERLSDEDLHRFATNMAEHVRREIGQEYAELVALERAPHEAGTYRSWEAFRRVSPEGLATRWWWSGDVFLSPPSMEASDFVRSTLRGALWAAPAAGAPTGEGSFMVKPMASVWQGVQEALLVKPASGTTDCLALLELPMVSAIRPVLPPGLEFAVIDQQGGVLFHSDSERNASENLFLETDGDRHLQSAVFARQSVTIDLPYWGDDYRASIVPVQGPSPWMIVALRHKDRVEAANLETVLTALVFLVAYMAAFALVLAAVALVRPGYRAAWLWPDPERADDYLRLVAVDLLLCAAFILAAFALPGDARLVWVAGLLPLLALVMGYLQLTRRRRRSPTRVAAGAVGLALLAVWALFATLGPDRRLFVPTLPLLAAAYLVFVHPRRWRRLTGRGSLQLSLAYPVLGLLTLVLTAVLPTLCIFKMAQTMQTNSMVKLGQLELAKELDERRIQASREQGARKVRRPDPLGFGAEAALGGDKCAKLRDDQRLACRVGNSLSFYGSSFFDTRIESPERDEAPAGHTAPDLLPEILAEWLPTYSGYPAKTRELMRDQAADWHWDRHGDRLELERRGLGVKLVSSLPRALLFVAALPGAGPVGEARSFDAAAVAFVKAVASAILLLALLARLAWFISRHVFLIDLFEPLWSEQEGELAAAGANLFLVSRRPAWRFRDPEGGFFRLRCKDLEGHPPDWPTPQLLWRSLPERDILVEGFEHRIGEPPFNDRKLALLEALVRERTVVVLSTVSPTPLAERPDVDAREGGEAAGSQDASPGREERWRALLDKFTLVDQELVPGVKDSEATVTVASLRKLWRQLRRGATAAAGDRLTSALLRRECGEQPFLLQIGCELDLLAPRLDRQRLLEEFYDRAEGYYQSLWMKCSRDEKVVLGHLAEDGLVNEKNRRLVRRLMARGLIRRRPVFQLMNETFRRFVLSPACRSEVQQLEPTDPSPWDRIRLPFFAVFAAGGVFFLGTQKELLEGAMPVVAAFTAGLPVLVKVADLFGGRRAGAAAK